MPLCTCHDIDIYYETRGAGWPLLFISGLSGGSWSWYEQVPFFADHFLTITYDNRGAGRSSMPPGPYTMKQLAEDARELLQQLGIAECFVLSLSMGGMIAQELALLAPAKIRAMVLGCTHCGGTMRVPPAPEVLQTFMNNEGLSHEQIVDKNLPFFFSEECRSKRPEVVTRYRKAQLETPLQPLHAFHAQLAAIAGFSCCDRLTQIKLPTLIVSGTADVLVPPENARILARLIANSELIEIAGAGHALHAECRDRLNQESLAFFQRNQP